MMRLQLIDHDGETIVTEFELGTGDGQWDVWNEDEGSMLLSEIQTQADCGDEDEQPTPSYLLEEVDGEVRLTEESE